MDYSNINEPRRPTTKVPAITRKPRGGQGSEMGSGRGSEDPHANAGSRKRNRDNEIEKVRHTSLQKPKTFQGCLSH